MKMLRVVTGALFAVSLASSSAQASGDELLMKLKCGVVHIKMFKALAPNHVKQMTKLAKSKFFDGIIFHRVIAGFMAQTGDPTGTGTGGSRLPDIKAEFNNVDFKRGIVGMARASDPDSANSQFFIMLAHKPHLNGSYTAWGKVTKGMECIDKINKGEPPAKPDQIISLRVK